MNSHEARVGTLVGLLDGVKRTGKGRIGTIVRIYGDPDDLAMDVRFEDGSVALYWYDELWGQSEYAAVDVLLEDGRSELFWLPDLADIAV